MTAAAAAAAAHHPGVVSPGTALMALAAAGEGSAHNPDIAGMLLARQTAAANALLQHAQQQQQHRAGGSFHGANGVIDEDSARGGSASGNLFGAHPAPGSSVGGSSGIMSRGNSLGGFSVGGSARGQFGALEMLQESGHQFAATTPPQQRFAPKRANPATGWVRPGYPGDEGYLGGGGGGLGHGLGSSFGETGVGGLSAMFASGLDVSGPGRATVAAPSLGTTPESTRLSNPTLDPGASPTSFTQRTGSVGSSLGSRGSSVRGGNAFGPGSSLVGAGGAGLGFSAASSSAGVAATTRAAASPVGSFNGGGLWSNGGESRGVGRDARSSSSVGAPMPTTKFPFPFPAVDRADTPGISPEDAREMLDRLESPDGVAGAEDDDAKRIVVVRGVPDVPEAELLLYRAFAPHGALASVCGGGRSRGAGTFREERGGARGARGGREHPRRTRRGGVDGPPRVVKRSVPVIATVSERVTNGTSPRPSPSARRASGPSRTISARRRDARVTITTSRHRARTSHRANIIATFARVGTIYHGRSINHDAADDAFVRLISLRVDFGGARVVYVRERAKIQPRHATRRDRLRRLSKPRALPRVPAVPSAPRRASRASLASSRASSGSTNPAARTMFLVRAASVPESGPFPRNASGFAAAFSSTFTALSNSRGLSPAATAAAAARAASSFLRSRRRLRRSRLPSPRLSARSVASPSV